jgi:hypothetical protein
MTKPARAPMTQAGHQEKRNEDPGTTKMTLYIDKSVAKEFKKLAIDKELDYSALATLAFQEYVDRHYKQ